MVAPAPDMGPIIDLVRSLYEEDALDPEQERQATRIFVHGMAAYRSWSKMIEDEEVTPERHAEFMAQVDVAMDTYLGWDTEKENDDA